MKKKNWKLKNENKKSFDYQAINIQCLCLRSNQDLRKGQDLRLNFRPKVNFQTR